MSFWSLAGTAISAAISVVSSVCSTLGSFGSSLFKTIEAFLPYLKSIVDVVFGGGKFPGIFEKEYTPDNYVLH